MTDNRAGRTRAEAKKASREALIRAGMELMPERGLDVSLDELCQHAGYTRGAFYVHFDNRDDLILEVMTRVGERMMDSLLGERDDAQPADLFTVASRFLPALFNGEYPLTRHGGMRPYQLLDACHRSERIQQRYIKLAQQSIERLAQNIIESQRKQMIRPELDAQQLSALIVAMVIGIHTFYDLDFPIDFQAGLQTFLALVTPAPVSS